MMSSAMQMYVDELVEKTEEAEKLHLNGNKCKERRISFSKSNEVLEPNVINCKEIEIISSSAKFLASISWPISYGTNT